MNKNQVPYTKQEVLQHQDSCTTLNKTNERGGRERKTTRTVSSLCISHSGLSRQEQEEEEEKEDPSSRRRSAVRRGGRRRRSRRGRRGDLRIRRVSFLVRFEETLADEDSSVDDRPLQSLHADLQDKDFLQFFLLQGFVFKLFNFKLQREDSYLVSRVRRSNVLA